MDHYPPLTDSSIILGTTTHLYLTVPSSWGPVPISARQFHHPGDYYYHNLTVSASFGHHAVDHYPPLPDSSIMLGTSTYRILIPSSWGPLPTSTWQFYHPRDHYLPLPDSSIILVTTTKIYLTVSSSWRSLPTSTWQFHRPGDHLPLLPDSSFILGTTNHPN